MRFMFDTCICIELIRHKPAGLLRRLRKMQPGDICISSITLSELEYGVEKSSAPERNKLALAEFMSAIDVVPYDDLAASRYGHIRAELENSGKPIGSLDTLIAAHAFALGVTLVTSNEREFRRISGLKVENWMK